MSEILVIDSLRGVRNILKERLEYEGYNVDAAESAGDGAAKCAAKHYDLLLCGDSIEKVDGAFKWIAISDSNDIERAVRCIKQGASDYIIKPVDMNRLLDSVRTALAGTQATVPQSEPVVGGVRGVQNRVEPIVGRTPAIMHVKYLIDKVAASDAKVLITGANGTGKELVARWLHEKSCRCEAPFVEVNCAAIPSELIESELFGHEKGAFTSAIKQRKGKFEQAIGGTLFLDEIGDTSLSAQAKVLRALQERKICRVGSDRDIGVDVRVLAATNKNLREEIDKGNFREDLYHRLSVILINVPPLSERRDDIPELVNYFLDKICFEYNIPVKTIENAAVDLLKQMPWTGNIREIHNVIERLIILSDNLITLQDVRTYVRSL